MAKSEEIFTFISLEKMEVACVIGIAEKIYQSALSFFTTEIPSILSLSAKALQKAQFPSTFAGFSTLSLKQWILLSPVITCILFVSFLPFILLYQSKVKLRTYREQNIHHRMNSYWLTRIAISRMTGLILFAAFTTFAMQGRGLYGNDGIFSTSNPSSSSRPTPAFDFIMNYFQVDYSDYLMEGIAWIGVVLSLFLLFSTFSSFLLPLALWLIYLSIVNLETNIMNYGWEWMTVEITFLLIFQSPIFSISKFPKKTPPSILIIWLYRWLAFRLLIGAGMSKIGNRSSACWFELTCTNTHYFTQPMPNFFSYFAHLMPSGVHQIEVLLTFFEQLILPFFILVPIRRVRIFAGLMEIFLQFAIVSTGNYAWINFLGVLPCLSLFDDYFLSFFFSEKTIEQAENARLNSFLSSSSSFSNDEIRSNINNVDIKIKEEKWKEIGMKMKKVLVHRKQRAADLKQKSFFTRQFHQFSKWNSNLYKKGRVIIYISLICFIGFKSAEPVKELFTESPWLHYYDEYFFVTSQGVFGFINQNRVVLSLQYTHDPSPLFNKSICDDQPKTSFNDQNTGKPFLCPDLSQYCFHPSFGAQIRSVCKRTCGECEYPDLQYLSWKNLDYKNLPGASLDKTPWFNSPIHYRLDWQIWIQTTASMENYHQYPSLQIPPFISKLIRKVLAGDSDAISLLGTPFADLFDEKGNPPSAIKAKYFKYEFSSWEHYRETGNWWVASEISNSKDQWFTSRDKWENVVHHSHPNRYSLLFICAFFFAVSFHRSIKLITHPKASKFYSFNSLILSSLFLATFLAMFFFEYPNQSPSFLLPYLSSFNFDHFTSIIAAILIINITQMKYYYSLNRSFLIPEIFVCIFIPSLFFN